VLGTNSNRFVDVVPYDETGLALRVQRCQTVGSRQNNWHHFSDRNDCRSCRLSACMLLSRLHAIAGHPASVAPVTTARSAGKGARTIFATDACSSRNVESKKYNKWEPFDPVAHIVYIDFKTQVQRPPHTNVLVHDSV
jgi:hypothetical protein